MFSTLQHRRVRGPAVIAAIFTSVILMIAGGAAWAMRVSPMVAEISTSGPGSSARIEVGNVGSAALPFETTITKLTFTDDGQIVETPAEENFLVFPPQGVVAVGGRQMVRLQWVGAPDLDVSEAYYLSVRQLPVSEDPTPPESGGAIAVTVLYNMKALVVVAPPGAQPEVKVVSATPTSIQVPAESGADGVETKPATVEPGVEVKVTNTGKRYALMSGASWLIEGTDKAGQPYRHQVAAGNELSAVIGVGYLAPAGGQRTFQLPTGGVELDPAKPINVRFGR